MKIVSIILALLFTMNAFAGDSAKVLEDLIDQYRYTLEVEWDQKDGVVADLARQQFLTDAMVLLKTRRISKEDVAELIRSNVADQAQANAFISRLSHLSAISDNDIARVLNESSRHFYAKGTSWNGEISETVQLALIIVIPIILGVALGLYERQKTEEYIAEEMKPIIVDGYCSQYGYANECATSGSWVGNTWVESSSCANVYKCLNWVVTGTHRGN